MVDAPRLQVLKKQYLPRKTTVRNTIPPKRRLVDFQSSALPTELPSLKALQSVTYDGGSTSLKKYLLISDRVEGVPVFRPESQLVS
jgi:hypothetical protein